MCYNYAADFPALGRNPTAARYFTPEDQEAILDPVMDGLTYPKAPVIRAKAELDDIETVTMELGFIPKYLTNGADVINMRKGYHDGNKYNPPKILLNAKGEELLLPEKRIYKDAARERRCLVPATGFYEYHHHYPIGKKGKQLKTFVSYPYYVRLLDAPLFSFAGVWQSWTDRETGETVDTMSIVTTDANELMTKIHYDKKRMPVILPTKLAEEWIMAETLDDSRLLELASIRYESDAMRGHTIDKEFKTSATPKAEVKYPELESPPPLAPTLFD